MPLAPRRVRSARRYDWARVRTAGGALPPAVYVCTIGDGISLNVYRAGSGWQWLVMAFDLAPGKSGPQSAILAAGFAGSMHEACLIAESKLDADQPQRDLGFYAKDGHDNATLENDLPF